MSRLMQNIFGFLFVTTQPMGRDLLLNRKWEGQKPKRKGTLLVEHLLVVGTLTLVW